MLIDLAIISLVGLPSFFARHKGAHEVASWPALIEKLLTEVRDLMESVAYFAIALKLGKGRTPGKWLMKIRVVSLTHHQIGWWQSIERGLGYGASLLEGGFGFAQYFLNRNRMCVHDRIAETIVVDLRKKRLHRHAEPHIPIAPDLTPLPIPAPPPPPLLNSD
jgi:uncharacterized RDD family membrane protein YckC